MPGVHMRKAKTYILDIKMNIDSSPIAIFPY